MVLHGWLDLAEAGHAGFEESAGRAVQFLVMNLRDYGTRRPECEYARLPHTYNARVARR